MENSSLKRPAAVWVQLLFFCLATFLLSWPQWLAAAFRWIPLNPLGSFAPSLSAVLLTWLWRGRPGVGDLLRGLGKWRAPLAVYAVAVFGPPVAHLTALFLTNGLAGLRPTSVAMPWYVFLLAPVEIFLLGGPLGEELGWRGFALPRLLQSGSPIRASLVVGAIWVIWHLPLFWIPGSSQADIPFLYFAPTLLAYSIVLTWLFMRSRGSLLIAAIFHTSTNTAFWIAQISFAPTLAAPAYGSYFVCLALAGGALAAFSVHRAGRKAL